MAITAFDRVLQQNASFKSMQGGVKSLKSTVTTIQSEINSGFDKLGKTIGGKSPRSKRDISPAPASEGEPSKPDITSKIVVT